MAEPIRIANCSGFFGDRSTAAREMVEGGPIDVLTGDWLAELTMLILSRTRQRRPDGGYARTFVQQLEQVMGTCLDRGIKVVANAGGLDPAGCAQAVQEVAERLGLHPKIAYVTGDDLMPRLKDLADEGVTFDNLDTGAPVADLSRIVTANAYLGCWGIVEALGAGADIVVTGRTTDAAIVCGPAAWRHGWRHDDWDALAGAVAAGHVIECGTQATGGNYSFFQTVPGLTRVGFPWAEIASDGSAVIGKHDGTGGLVSVGTVVSQLLYEIGAPAYLGPDVTTRFDTIEVEQAGPDRVRLSGTRGEPPPRTLKVAMNEHGGFRNEVNIALVGLDIEEKAAVLEEAFWRALPYEPADYASVVSRVVRSDHPNARSNEEATAVWRLTVKDPDEAKVGRCIGNAVVELGLSTIPGFFTLDGGPKPGKAYGVYRPALIPAALVPQEAVMLGGPTTVIEPIAPRTPARVVTPPEPTAGVPAGPTRPEALGRVAGARSGDKGGNANLGVFVRSDAAWAWLDAFLTTERLRALLPELAAFTIDRYRLPNLRSLNFVARGLLEEGVAASTRQDGQAKSLGEWLRGRVVDIPESLLAEAG
ncbi:acyclic terpene utilization AtuA family protein [Pseudofrankia inefficax]|uniref:Exopolyphosphatase n=1 Tax=Pseudofrankia inefficax (strain DSM 45817 / CECT 9037 / DDB 130130 / EuI1c) TaxID=298654 RepID=E3J924_PSEI1|nr:acyclic terpene utilization AtuA family protein [Pseudofrankia inefficax]ADP80903.1 protein of unknown function DUF1446 [Pseudofrankia inefficax]